MDAVQEHSERDAHRERSQREQKHKLHPRVAHVERVDERVVDEVVRAEQYGYR
jgi:hypothetical protein